MSKQERDYLSEAYAPPQTQTVEELSRKVEQIEFKDDLNPWISPIELWFQFFWSWWLPRPGEPQH